MHRCRGNVVLVGLKPPRPWTVRGTTWRLNHQNQHPRKTRLFHASIDRYGPPGTINHHGGTEALWWWYIARVTPRSGQRGVPAHGTQDMPVTLMPTHWRSGTSMQPTFSDSSVEIMSTERNEGQERWQPGVQQGPSRASEIRSGIRKQKILQKSRTGRPKHQTSLLACRVAWVAIYYISYPTTCVLRDTHHYY